MLFDPTRPAMTALSIDNDSMTLTNQVHTYDGLSDGLGRRRQIISFRRVPLERIAGNLLW
jgi:hypothetical protein